MPLAEWFKRAGVGVHWRAATSQSDRGGKRVTESAFPPNFGARYNKASLGITLTHLFDGEPAQEAGLSADDCIVAVNGLRLSGDKWESLLRQHQPGDVLYVHAFRRDELMEFEVKLGPPLENVCVLIGEDGDDARHLRDKWLGA
ncbi:MAG: PDZ domain-containing protein [Gammaproteobacteria bacterium]|nr:PDZ domain-containing protein [Gammaproteobacteria bacterium]